MKLGRNETCSCGSGKKYKKCCGQVISISLQAPASPRQARPCGECTACCEGWLKGTIRGHEMKRGTPCHFLRTGGCSIYEERPESPCREFICAWAMTGSPFPDDFAPAKLGVIIREIQWRGIKAYHLVSTDRDPDSALLDWMSRFSQQTGSPFFYQENGETVACGPTAFLQDVQARKLRGEAVF